MNFNRGYTVEPYDFGEVMKLRIAIDGCDSFDQASNDYMIDFVSYANHRKVRVKKQDIIVNNEYGDAEYIAYVPTRKLGVGPVAMVTTMYVSDVDSADGTRPVVVTDKDFTMIRPVPGLQ